MSDSTIDVRDNTTSSSKSVATKLDPSSNHLPVHVVTSAAAGDMVRGMVVTTDVASHTLFSAPANSPDLSYRNYVCSVQVANKGGSASLVGIYDGSITSPDVAMAYLMVPTGQTVTAVFQVPLRGSVASAINILADTASTIYVSAQGYVAA